MLRWSRPVTTVPHCAPWEWEGTSTLSAARKKTAWPSGPEIIRPSRPANGVSTRGRSCIQRAYGFKATPFPCIGGFAPPVLASLYWSLLRLRGGGGTLERQEDHSDRRGLGHRSRHR